MKWLAVKPLTRQNATAGATVARVHVWAEEGYTPYLAMRGIPGSACDWAVIEVQRHSDTRLAHAPR